MNSAKQPVRLLVRTRVGSSKSRFAATVVKAQIGKLLYIDTEKKAWGLPKHVLEHPDFFVDEVCTLAKCLQIMNEMNSQA